MNRKKKKGGLLGSLKVKLIVFAVSVIVFILLTVIMGILATISEDTDSAESNYGYDYASSGGFPDEIEAYRSLITELCEEYNSQPDKLNLPDYVNAMLAIIQIESSGLGNDPMQASECSYNIVYGNTPNAIQSAEYSCRCGVQYARDAFIKFGVSGADDFERMAAAVQGYNFGITEWYNWISERGGKYSVDLAKEYSDTKMPEGEKGTPTHGQKFLTAYKAAVEVNIDAGNEILDSIVYYKQWDERWSRYPYGSSTIQSCGCGITCMAMIVATLSDESVTPPIIADLSMENGGYSPGNGSIMSVVAEAACRQYSLKCQSITASEIPQYISEKSAFIIWGCKTGYFSNSSAGHVMIIRNMTEDGNYLLADPNRVENNTKEFTPEFIQGEAKGYYIAVWK